MRQLSTVQNRNFTLLKVFLVVVTVLMLFKVTESILQSAETALPQAPHSVESRG
jgi:hypothetical protein